METNVQTTIDRAQKGNPVAQFDLGFRYYYGAGVELNTEKGIEWLKKSADQGNPDAEFFLKAISSN